MNEFKKEFLEVDSDDNWKPCLICKGKLIQIRKALFSCESCNMEYIADEGDMRK